MTYLFSILADLEKARDDAHRISLENDELVRQKSELKNQLDEAKGK